MKVVSTENYIITGLCIPIGVETEIPEELETLVLALPGVTPIED